MRQTEHRSKESHHNKDVVTPWDNDIPNPIKITKISTKEFNLAQKAMTKRESLFLTQFNTNSKPCSLILSVIPISQTSQKQLIHRLRSWLSPKNMVLILETSI